MRKIFVAGATSAIAQQTLRLFAKDGDRFFLVGRNREKLMRVSEDLMVRGAGSVDLHLADLNDFKLHQAIIDQAIEKMSGIDFVLVAHGTLGIQQDAEKNFNVAEQIIKTNFLSVVSLLTYAANYLAFQRQGCIIIISSVAGDRGRGSNYIYGTSKGALTIFLQGLRNRLHKVGVKVITIKPGFVDTPMTSNMEKTILFSKPEVIAKGIMKAFVKQKDILYVPFYWKYIMFAIKSIPERYFKKLNL